MQITKSVVPAVLALQTKLRDDGFEPGALDGVFGPATEAALAAYQYMHGLPPDGIFDGPTAEALGLAGALLGHQDFKSVLTISVVARMFPGATLDPIKAHLPEVLDALVTFGVQAVAVALATLATIRAEVGNFLPISERSSKLNTSAGGQPFDLYDNRKDLGNLGPPDGATFRGRGYVQLTGRANYAKYGPIIGVGDLVDYPGKANQPDVAAAILAAFVASKEREIEQALLSDNLAQARKLVNGGTNGLAQFTDAYRAGVKYAAITQQLPAGVLGF